MSNLEELRRDPAAAQCVIQYAESRIDALKIRLIAPLLNERESDMVRGKIAELKKLINEVQDTGEADE